MEATFKRVDVIWKGPIGREEDSFWILRIEKKNYPQL